MNMSPVDIKDTINFKHFYLSTLIIFLVLCIPLNLHLKCELVMATHALCHKEETKGNH